MTMVRRVRVTLAATHGTETIHCSGVFVPEVEGGPENSRTRSIYRRECCPSVQKATHHTQYECALFKLDISILPTE